MQAITSIHLEHTFPIQVFEYQPRILAGDLWYRKQIEMIHHKQLIGITHALSQILRNNLLQ